MSSTSRFQGKLWDLVNSGKSRSVQWNVKGDGIVFNFPLFKKEFLDSGDKFCKSNKITSFVRQLNLYGFKKVSDSRRSRRKDIHEFQHPWFVRGREDCLKHVIRNSVPCNNEGAPPRRRRKRGTKKSKVTKSVVPRVIAPKGGRRGRPRKAELERKSVIESNNGIKQEIQSDEIELKELEAWAKSTSRLMLSPKKEEDLFFHDMVTDPSEPVTYSDIINPLFTATKSLKKEKVEEYVPKYYTPLLQKQHEYPNYGLQENKENIAPTSKFANMQSQWGWNEIKPVIQVPNHSNGILKPEEVNTNRIIECSPTVQAQPKVTNCSFKATIDENNNVVLKIDESSNTATMEKKTTYGTKLTIQNGHISRQIQPTERLGTFQNVSTKAAEVNFYDYRRITHNFYGSEEMQPYEPYSLYKTDSYITQEFLDIREAYFKHYPERRPAVDGPDLRIYS